MPEKLGLVHVYTGDGKGKTTAAVGIALRAIGQGLRVAIIQFMKGGEYTGECIAAKNYIPNLEFQQFGRGCYKERKQLKLLTGKTDNVRENIDCGKCRDCFVNDEGQEKHAQKALKRAMRLVKDSRYNIIILDEINMAESLGFVKESDIGWLLDNKNAGIELILTGRNANKRTIERADYATIMNELKHPFKSQNIRARRGIEY